MDGAQSGVIVEKHINGISFRLWTLIAVLIAMETLTTIFQTKQSWDQWAHRHGVLQSDPQAVK